MKLTRLVKQMCMVSLLVVVGSAVRADFIAVDFGVSVAEVNSGSSNPFGGGGTMPSGVGSTWNNFTVANGTTSDLLYYGSGLGSGIGLTLTGFSGNRAWNQGREPDPALNGGLFADPLLTDDGVFSPNNGTSTLTLSGLNNGLTYDLVLFGSRLNTADAQRWTTYTVTAGTPSGGTVYHLQTGGSTLTDGWNSNTVVNITGITPSSGSITFTVQASSLGAGGTVNTFGPLNGMQISVVPEPGTAAFTLVGGLMVLWARRLRS